MDIEVQAFLRPSWLRPGRESNSRPDAYKSGALPSKLTKLAVLLVFIMSIINIKRVLICLLTYARQDDVY